jgi:molybdopterin-guanine dinucleotide biosynthesis protein A
MIHSHQITGLVLAGGRGSRMGGADKGLQSFNGTPLALHTLLRLQMQEGGLVGDQMINANRNLAAYEAFGVPVWPDTLDGYAGPLAGFMTGLERCETPFLLTVPCDTPLYPLDLAVRMAKAFDKPDTEMAMAAAREEDGQLRAQPVFCLMKIEMLESLTSFVQGGGRKIDRWTAGHRTVLVPFDQPADDPKAFFNANTLAELHALENP